MATAFPAIRPTSRRYQLPTFPVTQFKSQSGVTSMRLWGSKPENARLQLSFTNISDDKALQLSEVYLAAKGPIDTLDLPAEVFSGSDTRLAAFIRATGTGITWHFTPEPPTIDAVSNGVSSVSITLIGILKN
jgi:hypothetical protein